ncbi:MAG: hypothetical protein LBC67_02160 [Spirochaetales bacterium]|jgi:hypothetical protein|nr:hypothetical protein [Spirochaetales bacterium]
MMRVLVFLSVCAAFLQTPGLAAEDSLAPENDEPRLPEKERRLDESFFSALENALNMNIAARISEAGESAVWNVESNECTVSGRSVSVKLVGKNIVIIAEFTPYVGADNSIVLVAQGQVWIASPEEPLKYLSALTSIPVNLGERVLFFPLGVKSLEASADNTYDIELEIKILPRLLAEKGGSSR